MGTRVRPLVFVAVALAAAGGTWAGRHFWNPSPAPPILNFDPTLDLGEREHGEIAIGHFTVANPGGSELELREFFTS